MEFDYFYGQQAEQFTFYRIPKVLFTDSRFWNVSTDAKLLYFNPPTPCGVGPPVVPLQYGSTHFNPPTPCGVGRYTPA